jgi:hemoglobin
MKTKISLRSLAVGVMCTGALAASLVITATNAWAQQADDSIYRAFGEKPGITALVDDLMVRLLADSRMNPFFKDIDQPEFKTKLVAQLCDVSGGPCKTVNTDMKKTHSGYDINANNFNALVEVLQASMDAQGIAFADQNRMLSKLAPMHRDIINVH